MSFRLLALLIAVCAGAALPVRGSAEISSLPWQSSDLAFVSGVLWQVGNDTPLSYRLVPTQLAWRSPAFFARRFTGGTSLAVRHRLALLGTWIQSGPESRYVGVGGSPSLEWWSKEGNWAVFATAGGGFGWVDSRGVVGGQGQDFTLNWFTSAGVEHVTARNLRVIAGLMFQHMSNGGQTSPNPGIDALGVTLGCSWRY